MITRKLIVAGMAAAVLSAAVLGVGTWLGSDLGLEVQAAGGKVTDPKGTAPDRYVYYPGTEALREDEIRD